MKFGPIEIKDKLGRTVILRNTEPEDAEILIDYLRITSAETRFIMREPEEVTYTVEQEIKLIDATNESDGDLMMAAFIDGRHVGNCSVNRVGRLSRVRHRCSMGISLYKEFWGLGIGRQMIKHAISAAREMGFEQMELGVLKTNERAIALYKSLGFREYGRLENAMKYKDGTYADEIVMCLKL